MFTYIYVYSAAYADMQKIMFIIKTSKSFSLVLLFEQHFFLVHKMLEGKKKGRKLLKLYEKLEFSK